ncbi:MAG: hypothetical protein ACFFCS_19490 [Candidatus Hodarchaeota archaeon]
MSDMLTLKRDIIKSIQKYGKFWLFFKEGYPGMAANIDFLTKKIYTEFVILPSDHPDAPCTIKSYGKTSDIDFSKLRSMIQARHDVTRQYINPDDIIESVMQLQDEYMSKAKILLERELFEITRRYENDPVEKNPYTRKLLIHFGGRIEEITINFQNYPGCPKLLDQERLLKKLKINDVNGLQTIRKWNEREPIHVFEIIEEICAILFKMEASIIAKNQVFKIRDLKLEGTDTVIDFQIPRGNTLGFVMEGEETSSTFKGLSDCLIGLAGDEKNKVDLFGKIPGKERATSPAKIIQNTITDVSLESRVKPLLGRILREKKLGFKKQKRTIKSILEALTLKPVKKRKLLSLSNAEKLRLNVALSLARGTEMLIADLHQFNINRLEYGQVEKVLRTIAHQFHAIVISVGPVEIISRFDKIITISKAIEKTTTESVQDYREKLPGEVVILQVKDVPMDFKKHLEKKVGSLIIEEVISERFKIFTKGDPNPLIVDLCKELGEKIYKITRKMPNVDDYLEYTRLTGYNQMKGNLRRDEAT